MTFAYVLYEPICDLSIEVIDDSINVYFVCQQLSRIHFGDCSDPATTELIEWQYQVGHLCLDTCVNLDAAHGCFSEQAPPSCDDERSTKQNTEIKNSTEYYDDTQTICYDLSMRYVNPNDISSHWLSLSRIHADSDFCTAVQQVYPHCYWCAPNFMQEQQYYCQLNCFSVPDVPDDLVDVNATCHEE